MGYPSLDKWEGLPVRKGIQGNKTTAPTVTVIIHLLEKGTVDVKMELMMMIYTPNLDLAKA